VLYDALLHLGYNRDISVYCYHMSMAHGLDKCEVSVTIPLNPMEPWMGTIIGSEQDDTVEQTAHIAITSFCESRLAATTEMPIMLFPIHNYGDPVWRLCLDAMSDLEGPHIHAGMVAMAKYAQYSFNLQHNLARTVI
jgi:hypothetical protein